MIIVFKVAQRDEMAEPFQLPSEVERKRMDLKQYQVHVPPALRPMSPDRISVADPIASDVMALESGSELGDALGGSTLDEIELVPGDFAGSFFGGPESVNPGNDFEGTLYVLNRSRDGTELGSAYGMQDESLAAIRRFLDGGWSPYQFADYYRAPKKMYTTHFMIPIVPAVYGPRAFGVKCDSSVEFPTFVIHYKGKVSSKKGGRYRFWGSSAQILCVRINGKMVLNASYGGWQSDISTWESDYPSPPYRIGFMADIGHWFELKPNEPVEMEVLFGTIRPPRSGCYLVIEDEAEQEYYSRKKLDDCPILPVFRTADISSDLKDQIKYLVYKEDVDLDGGEVFNVY
jgi:hypothetical protein